MYNLHMNKWSICSKMNVIANYTGDKTSTIITMLVDTNIFLPVVRFC